MNTDIPFVGKRYRVVDGPYRGFAGNCVSYDLGNELPIILQNERWDSRAVKIAEVEEIEGGKIDINNEQQN